MKKDWTNFIRGSGETDIATAKLIYDEENLKALFLSTEQDGYFYIASGKKSEIEIPITFDMTAEIKAHWIEVYDDSKRIFRKYYEYAETKKIEIYQRDAIIIIAEVDE